ncbi:MAG: carbonic anhydrase [Candidatus Binataceae bacterium]
MLTRNRLATAMAIVAIVALAPIALHSARADAPASTVAPADALKQLLEGNQRFVDGKSEHPNQDAARRDQLVGGQHPFAAILSCSDSRTTPEIIFDQGLGDLFIVRDAGNVPNAIVLESLHYAVAHLGSRVILVLGHSNCGAVKATLAGQTGDVPEIAKLIRPAVEKSKGQPGDPLDNAIKENVRLTVAKLSAWKPLADSIKSGDIQVVGGIYDLQSGRVTLIDQPGGSPSK